MAPEAAGKVVRFTRRVLRRVVGAAKKLARKQPDVSGFVERIDPYLISGWAYSRSGKPLELSVRVNGQVYAQQPAWNERVDVAAGAGAAGLKSGFRIAPSDTLRSALSREGLEDRDIDVLAGGRLLPKVQLAFRPQHVPAEAIAIRTEAGPVQAAVESWQPFVIRGWAMARDVERTEIDVLAEGRRVECSIVRSRREDIGAADRNAEAGFEIELPGYLWEVAGRNDECSIEIRVNGLPITPAPLVLSAEKVVRWILDIASLGEGPQRQYFGLLALEHLRFGRFYGLLADEAKQFVRALARETRLEDFVFIEIGERVKAVDVPSEDPASLQMGAAMRDLNVALEKGGEQKFEVVQSVLKNHKLRGAAREWYQNLAVQIACTTGEFARVRKSLDVRHLYPFESSSQPRLLSLLLPSLVAEAQVRRAAEVLRRLSRHFERDWFHTECIAHSVREVQRLEREGKIDSAAAESFREAVVGLLDGFKGEWFSRLHDRELVDSMIAVVGDLARYREPHRRAMVAAAIRHYGLSPTFWERLGGRARGLTDEEFNQAAEAWRVLADGLRAASGAVSARLEALVGPAAFFHQRGNPEALVVLRELTVNSLRDLDQAPAAAAARLVETLLSADPAEAMRVSAFPHAGEDALHSRFPGLSDRLFDVLRRLGKHPTSPKYDAQCAGAAALRSAQAAAASRHAAALQDALREVEARALALSDRPAAYLGADLLASAVVLAAEAGISTQSLLARLEAITRAALDDPSAGKYPPAPVCSALAQLGALPASAGMPGWAAGAREVVHRRLELRGGGGAVPVAGRGWPGDTLVAICSRREHLETRIRAIRETWARDLQARGIPFIVVVGGGAGALRGDVLELAASDHHEDMPAKTLELLDWACRHSDAQYVLKINDDCYLDVGRYFDTLSYRKYPYYGRAVRCSTGSMDRAAHQQKSAGIRARKSLDKSPEPSEYADGEGGYCLSRPAMLKLREAAESGAGRRLVGASMREDKLVGDLLALCGIAPHDEDLMVHRCRRLFPGAMPVAMHENTFMPSRLSPTKIAHLDGWQDFAATRHEAAASGVWPKKIWPTCAEPKIWPNSNQLELLGERGKAQSLLREELVVVAVVRNEMVMLPHFLAHYRGLGIRCFVFVDNCSDDGTREYLVSQPDAVVYSADTEYRRSHYGVTWQQAVMGNLCLGKWVLLADADEFLVYEDCETVPLAELTRSIDRENRDGALLYMIDMYPYGDLGDADFAKGEPFALAPYFDKDPLIELRFGGGSYSNSRNFVNGLRHRIAPSRINAYVSQKYALFRYRPWIRVSEGVHYSANIAVSAKPLFFAHFKYHAGFKHKVLTEVSRNQHFNGAEEYRRYIAMLAEGMGGFGAEASTTRYRGSRSFVQLVRDR